MTPHRHLDLEPPSPIWGWLLMPARLVVAAFLHLEQAMKPNVTDDFGRAFRSRRAPSDDAAIRRAIAEFDNKHNTP